jgi:tryptophan 2,3-dioxygenase
VRGSHRAAVPTTTRIVTVSDPQAPSGSNPVPAAFHGTRLDSRGEMTYPDHLRLDQLLGAQARLSDSHHEWMFIALHQTAELWMKLLITELDAAQRAIRADDLGSASATLARCAKVLELMVKAWDVLATLTPQQFLEFRGALGTSSGFQSYQYRTLEFLLGNKRAVLLEPHRHRPEVFAELQQRLAQASLYDTVIALVAKRGLPIAASLLARDVSREKPYDASLEAAWLAIYRETDQYRELFELGERLVELEAQFRVWRFHHVTTVERVIGFKQGTGGTAGVAYLREMLNAAFFPELWRVRTLL